MADDDDLAERVRALLAREPDRAERRMFGGLALLLGGRMALAVTGRGELMVRAGADAAEELLERAGVEPVVMRGRPTRGWVLVRPEVLEDDDALGDWVARGAATARSLGPRR
ncbi:TfoX/Sxy family protein [uncultured Pseudokineococcus sp.]|uniref:TfoX/Sxy family protein n=1 Tax=uncultured Pseudokineococcus sp. TaxID=1642928 RepID=UPI002635CF5C|nr:TfoX/Sxy family protein [uncultured Pseudokineococcus sp.]